ncbi:HAD-IIIA family hydrolase [Phytoactinopolyspora alkaliphila]|uniref:D,D-heptose 1,7-bisphosphate phosphatase n=1 Tax=Phytoactinopolyspora alkaliphila TaxID=1783498 RepID=A0A6N9YLU6_9ACTN|nr:HAD-IIIA family hydrolase [Phytoactinopolyspora alkaliphila]NED95935.1 HAD-IIIA family hydrolase [Phytoactinopolyspora alkaliphila]
MTISPTDVSTTIPTTVVVPTVGRPSLHVLLERLRTCPGPRPAGILVLEDTERAGPAATRNRGWRLARTPWVSFLDDDVVPDADWLYRLQQDIDAAEDDVVGIQGQVTVPLSPDRRPTDWERATAGLQDAAWITADMTYRRSALAAVGGFDERFRRAFREDADLALRLMQRGRMIRGRRQVAHPVRPAGFWVSVRTQAGNADDVLMRRLHGPGWRTRAAAGRGRRRRHLAVTACGVAGLALAVLGHRRAAAAAATAWLAGTAEFAAARIAPGPRTAAEITRMLVTSALIPPAATVHTVRGLIRHRQVPAWAGVPELVLFDRDGTLVRNVPYNGDPRVVEPVPGAAVALTRLRSAGIRVGVVTNQSGIASGRLTRDEVERVNERVDQLLGPFDVWRVCPHGPDEGCGCRKPAPGMVSSACAELGIDPSRCAVIGDIGSDVAAAEAAGASGVLVPTEETRPAEIGAASRIATDVPAAVDALMRGY